MVFRGLGGNTQAVGDFDVAQALIDQIQDLRLPPCEPRGVGAGAGGRTPRNRPRAPGAHPASEEGGSRSGRQTVEDLQRLALRLLIALAQRERLFIGLAERHPAGGGGAPAALTVIPKWRRQLSRLV